MLGDVLGLTVGVTMRVTEYRTAPVLGEVGSAVAWLGWLCCHPAESEVKKHDNQPGGEAYIHTLWSVVGILLLLLLLLLFSLLMPLLMFLLLLSLLMFLLLCFCCCCCC